MFLWLSFSSSSTTDSSIFCNVLTKHPNSCRFCEMHSSNKYSSAAFLNSFSNTYVPGLSKVFSVALIKSLSVLEKAKWQFPNSVSLVEEEGIVRNLFITFKYSNVSLCIKIQTNGGWFESLHIESSMTMA